MTMISLLTVNEDAISRPREITQQLKKLLGPFGGGEFFFNDYEKPLFLVDLTLPAGNEVGANFDVRLAYAVLMLAKENGVEDLVLGVRPAEGFSFQQVLEKSGYAELCTLTGAKAIDLSAEPTTARMTDVGLAMDRAEVAKAVAEADVLISLAKSKAGSGRLFGGAMANAELAAPMPQEISAEHRARAAVDLYSVATPDLVIADGIIGEGAFQPHGSDFILAATDGVAADAVLSAIAGISLEDNEPLQLAAGYGLGIAEPAGIHVYGDDISDFMA